MQKVEYESNSLIIFYINFIFFIGNYVMIFNLMIFNFSFYDNFFNRKFKKFLFLKIFHSSFEKFFSKFRNKISFEY